MSNRKMLAHAIRSFARFAMCMPWNIAAKIGGWRGAGLPVQFVAEDAEWAIRWEGEGIKSGLTRIAPDTLDLITEPHKIVHRVVHFGSQYRWEAWAPFLSKTNRYAVSFFHGKPEDGSNVELQINRFLKTTSMFSLVIVANKIVEQRLLSWNIDKGKIVRIPIGVDIGTFSKTDSEQKEKAREALGIPQDAMVVGSFQKDGVGWGKGMIPKLIKGPDLFLAVIEQLARDFPVHVLLTGPARGYVIEGLRKLGIPYIHRYLKHQASLVGYYHALDLYLITSREEGGPKGLMESMAARVPVVSTAVGMAPDLIVDGVNGGLAVSEDVEGLLNRAQSILALDNSVRAQLTAEAHKAVQQCDWSVVARRHWEDVYQPLLNETA